MAKAKALASPGRRSRAGAANGLSDRLARRISAYWLIDRQGWSAAAAAAAVGFSSARLAAKWAKQVATTGIAADSGDKRGPKACLHAGHARLLGGALLADKVGLGTHRVAERLRQGGAAIPPASASTVLRALRAHGFEVQPTKPDLGHSAEERAARARFCRAMRDVRLNIRGAFSDSKIFYGGGSYHAGRSGRAWAKRGQPRKRDRRKAASRAHVYAAVTPYGATPLYFATGTTGVKGTYSRPRRVTKARLQEACQQLDLDARGTHAELMARIAGLGEDSDAVVQALGARPRASGVGNEEYMDILTGTGRYAQSRGMLGAIAHLFAPSPHAGNWWFQQDGARAHTLNPKTAAGRRTEAAILKVAPKIVRDWPARSPDLSLIENAWARCQDYLWKHESWGDSAEFCAALERAWRASVTPEYCRNLFRSWEARRAECAESGGDRVRA